MLSNSATFLVLLPVLVLLGFFALAGIDQIPSIELKTQKRSTFTTILK